MISEYVPLRWCLSGEESACSAGDADLIPGSGKSPEVENGSQIQYSCLENPMDRGTWRATVLGDAKSQTQLKQLGMHTRFLMMAILSDVR